MLLVSLALASVTPVALDTETLSEELDLNLTELKDRRGGRGDASGMSANIGPLVAGYWTARRWSRGRNTPRWRAVKGPLFLWDESTGASDFVFGMYVRTGYWPT